MTTTTRESAEQLALRGLLMTVVEVQNQVRRVTSESDMAALFDVCADIDQVVESSTVRELVQLARRRRRRFQQRECANDSVSTNHRVRARDPQALLHAR